MKKPSIAIIGGGISGLSAAYLLQKNHDVTIYEASDKFGGHARTIHSLINDKRVPVDVGFIVYNKKTYPNFCKLIDDLGVESQSSDMSFAIYNKKKEFYYSSSGFNGLFAQKRNLLSGSFWRLLIDIVRFNINVKHALKGYVPDSLTLAEYLARGSYSFSFQENYIFPMIAAIWSTPLKKINQFPANLLFKFMHHHGLLNFFNRPKWMTIKNGSEQYVTKLVDQIDAIKNLNTPVKKVTQKKDGRLSVETSLGVECFEHVVMACSSECSYNIISDNFPQKEWLKKISFTKNDVVLHMDSSVMPPDQNGWGSWTFLDQGEKKRGVSLNYWMNNLQLTDLNTSLFVTLNPSFKLEKILYRTSFSHPVYTVEAQSAKKQIRELQGSNHLWICGAYMHYGFHEDGVQSAIDVADNIICWKK